MKKSFFAILTLFVFSISIGSCATIGPESQTYKASILYFEGGDGSRKTGNDWLINRCRLKFSKAGLLVEHMPQPYPKLKWFDPTNRITISHISKIEEEVESLKKKGHRDIWLMGISNGTVSVAFAGHKNIKDVKGIILINPVRNIYNPHTRKCDFFDLKTITLPVLVITHIDDGSSMRGMSTEYISSIFSSSKMVRKVTFTGGRVGVGYDATGRTQKWQHGLRGLEDEFVMEVVKFIDANQTIAIDEQ